MAAVFYIFDIHTYGELYTKNYKKISRKVYFAQLNVSTSPEMLEWSCLDDKEMDMYFHAQR